MKTAGARRALLPRLPSPPNPSSAWPCWSARQGGVPFAWITGDSVYGADHAIRRWAERHRRGDVLAVTANHYLGQRPVTSWIKRLPRKAGQRLSAGDGAKGPRRYDWTYIPHSGAAPGFQCGLLVRRSIADPTELTFDLTHAPKDTALAKLVQVAGLRWPIESLFEQGKLAAAQRRGRRQRATSIRLD